MARHRLAANGQTFSASVRVYRTLFGYVSIPISSGMYAIFLVFLKMSKVELFIYMFLRYFNVTACVTQFYLVCSVLLWINECLHWLNYQTHNGRFNFPHECIHLMAVSYKKQLAITFFDGDMTFSVLKYLPALKKPAKNLNSK